MTLAFSSLVELQTFACATYADRPLFGTKEGGTYTWLSYGAFGEQVAAARSALRALGVGPGDAVAVIANNRVEWAVGAFATYGLGAKWVPMYEAQLPKDWRYILEDSAARVLLTSTPDIYAATSAFVGEITSLEHVLSFDAPEEAEESWARQLREASPSEACDAPAPSDIAGLVYTSGTTGAPKGVILSHSNFTSNVNAVNAVFPFQEDDCSCSFLPWAHSFGQTAELYCMMSRGGAIGIAESVHTLQEDFLLVRPTVLFAVPRVFNRIYDGITKRLAEERVTRRAIFELAMSVSAEKRALHERGLQSVWVELRYAWMDRLVFSRVRERFGGRLRYAFSGGAALQAEVATFIDNVGIIVFEGYGLSETSPIASANRPDARRFGTIGKPIPGVQVFICDSDQRVLPVGEEGEIVVVGPNVMQGYHNQPEKTAEVIFDLDGQRAFRTGDIGCYDADGFIRVVGRLKEQYKLENGKYVVPTPLEEQLQLSGLIQQAYLWGDNRPHNVCLVVPDAEACAKWVTSHGGGPTDPASLASNEALHAKIGEELERCSAGFKGYERPRAWSVLSEEFTIENGLLTPKMSVRRRVVRERYAAQLDALYDGASAREA